MHEELISDLWNELNEPPKPEEPHAWTSRDAVKSPPLILQPVMKAPPKR